MNRAVEEVLYSAMEDFRIDVMLGQGPGAQSVSLPLPPFTLIGATTRAGLLTRPLRDRFQIQFQMEFYQPEELSVIITKSAERLGVSLTPDASLRLAKRSRGTPRVANRMLRRARDFAQVEGNGTITLDLTKFASTDWALMKSDSMLPIAKFFTRSRTSLMAVQWGSTIYPLH